MKRLVKFGALTIVLSLTLGLVNTQQASAAEEPPPAPPPEVYIPYYTISRTPDADPGYPLRHDWWAAITLESGYPSAAFEVYSQGIKSWQARSVHGYDALGGTHDKNYVISGMSAGSVKSKAGNNSTTYGQTLIMWDGAIFEGCHSYNNYYGYYFVCDFYSAKYTNPWGQNQQGTLYVLRRTWDKWWVTPAAQFGCAFAIGETMARGASWTTFGLTSCIQALRPPGS